MKQIYLSFFILLYCLNSAADPPAVFLTDVNRMMEFKKEIQENPDLYDDEIDDLKRAAREKLKEKVYSVMDKEQVPPSGDKHDYMSQGPYWWPDPDQPDGLPYIRKDGERNPEIKKITDHDHMYAMIDAVRVLSLAYFYLEKERYARKAAKFLRTWFLNEKTAMNPNLEFGQGIPGRTKGRGIGIIETRKFCYLIDAIGLIEDSESWTPFDQIKMKEWIGDYLEWLLNSEHGKDEAVHGNNHTTWYFVQTIAMALFVDKPKNAEDLIDRGYELIIENQITPDGKQPEELARTRAWDYSAMNLNAIYNYGIYAERFETNIWKVDKIRLALEYLIPYINNIEEWPYQQITSYNKSRIEPCLRIGYYKFGQPKYKELVIKYFNENNSEDFWNFYYPF